MAKDNKIGIIAGNRFFPLLLAKRIKESKDNYKIIAICFKGETSKSILKYVDKAYWIEVGQLKVLQETLLKENINECIMAGQINPLRIFNRKNWDNELNTLVEKIEDFRPHTIFGEIINYLEDKGIDFLDSILFLKDDLAKSGVMNALSMDKAIQKDVEFGLDMVSRFVELDVGQTLVVKQQSVVALESLEGTDNTIKRAKSLVGGECTVFKFCKKNQDLRFDVPVVGLSTLKLLGRIKAKALVLESNKVIILQRQEFLSLARKMNIVVLGKERSAV